MAYINNIIGMYGICIECSMNRVYNNYYAEREKVMWMLFWNEYVYLGSERIEL